MDLNQNPSTRICPPSEFNHYKEVTAFFYKQCVDGTLEFLLYSKRTDPQYKTVVGPFDEIDATITFTITRLILEQTYGCLSKKVQQKAAGNETITKDDLIFPQNLILPEVWSSHHFIDLLKCITACYCQFDEHEGKIVYFIKMNEDYETERVNEGLKHLEVDLSFKWVQIEEITKSGNMPITKELKSFFDVVDVKHHIDDAQRYNDEKDQSKKNIYIVMLCKPQKKEFEKSNVDIFYEHLSGLFVGIYKRNKETWLVYNAARDEYPSEDVLKHAKALIIPGSPVSIYDEDDWNKKAKKWLKDWYDTYKQTRYFGVCYGEQMIAEVLGGKTEPMEGRRRDKKYFFSTNELIQLSDDLYKMKFMKKNQIVVPKTIRMMQAHGDEVTSIPQDFSILGSSESCKAEIIVSKDQRAFAIQGHPEYTAEYMAARGSVMFSIMKGVELTKEFYEEVRKEWLPKYPKCHYEGFVHRKLCYDFLKYQE